MQISERSATEVWAATCVSTGCAEKPEFEFPTAVSSVCALPFLPMVSGPTFLFLHSTSGVAFCSPTDVNGWGCGLRQGCGVITRNESNLWGSAEGCRHCHLSCQLGVTLDSTLDSSCLHRDECLLDLLPFFFFF